MRANKWLLVSAAKFLGMYHAPTDSLPPGPSLSGLLTYATVCLQGPLTSPLVQPSLSSAHCLQVQYSLDKYRIGGEFVCGA